MHFCDSGESEEDARVVVFNLEPVVQQRRIKLNLIKAKKAIKV